MNIPIPEVKALSDRVSAYHRNSEKSFDTCKDDCDLDSIKGEFHAKSVWENNDFVGLSYVEIVGDVVKISFLNKSEDISNLLPLPMFRRLAEEGNLVFTEGMAHPFS